MADDVKSKETKDKGGSSKKSSSERPRDVKAVSSSPPKGESAKDAHTDAHAHGHGHKIDRKQYMVIFVMLFVMTVLEVLVAKIPGVGKVLLVSLALAKAACVGLYYMHLKFETKILKMMVVLPFVAPTVYAVVLIAEGAWRLAR